MESYTGIKFGINFINPDFQVDNRLQKLHRWVCIFAELGLAPVHSQGAFGNHSYRDDGNTFVITRTGMAPEAELVEEDYCRVTCSEQQQLFLVEGKHQPSSECFLHHYIYQHDACINTIMHGHSSLLLRYAASLGIPVSDHEQPYGTVELAESAIAVLKKGADFFILRNHGFVAVGDDIDSTASRVLSIYMELIQKLQSAQ